MLLSYHPVQAHDSGFTIAVAYSLQAGKSYGYNQYKCERPVSIYLKTSAIYETEPLLVKHTHSCNALLISSIYVGF